MASGKLPGRREFLAGVASAGSVRAAVCGCRADAATTPHRRALLGLRRAKIRRSRRLSSSHFASRCDRLAGSKGGNIQIDYRFGGSLTDLSKTKASAAELVALKPDVIYSQGLPATLAVRQLTATIPIVFTQLIDPVGFGLAEGLSHPGGNVTGFIVWDFAIAGKWIQLLHELMHDLAEVGVLFNPDTAPYAPGLISAAREADRSVQIVECRTHSDTETEAVLSAFAREPRRALLVFPEPFTNGHRDHIIASCARLGLPAINSVLGARDNGALISYIRSSGMN
jgi:putative tryptophan/tyrosine transport system substrate-binding protein